MFSVLSIERNNWYSRDTARRKCDWSWSSGYPWTSAPVRPPQRSGLRVWSPSRPAMGRLEFACKKICSNCSLKNAKKNFLHEEFKFEFFLNFFLRILKVFSYKAHLPVKVGEYPGVTADCQRITRPVYTEKGRNLQLTILHLKNWRNSTFNFWTLKKKILSSWKYSKNIQKMKEKNLKFQLKKKCFMKIVYFIWMFYRKIFNFFSIFFNFFLLPVKKNSHTNLSP